ncbi:hypothetical protein ACNSOS_00090 [Aliarcobacter vitoriensis]|uniref:hypothetical protein n=1 Tax=Aliarcobacter vitoriensis TaxID=2011099 RepID=UPI003AAA8746
MDIDSIEALEKALLVYDKALIVVSHDKTFIERLELKLWSITKENTQKFTLAI